MIKPPLQKPSSTAPVAGIDRPIILNAEANVEPQRNNENIMRKVNANRRSRCYSRTFVMHVMNRNEGVSIPEPVIEEEVGLTARPVVRKIVDIAQKIRTDDGQKVSVAIGNVLQKEKGEGTPWREIADETIMELIIREVNGYNFVLALISIYAISAYDVGRFIATPPDEGTMSLIEEAVCQDTLDLFDEVLKLDSVMQGVLECEDLSDEVRNILHTII